VLFTTQIVGLKMIPALTTLLLFRISPEDQSGARSGPVKGKKTSTDLSSDEYRALLCRACRQVIAHNSARITKNGRHMHTFANPHGIVFEIGCFNAANGCDPIGPASAEFSWFPGFCWQIIVCQSCRTHLGWIFWGKNSNSFFGLIIDRLILPDAT
jgi:hypothetical protein